VFEFHGRAFCATVLRRTSINSTGAVRKIPSTKRPSSREAPSLKSQEGGIFVSVADGKATGASVLMGNAAWQSFENWFLVLLWSLDAWNLVLQPPNAFFIFIRLNPRNLH
jgi:hypothetical protein